MIANQINSLLRAAIAHHQAGRLDAAETIYRRIRAAGVRNFDVFYLSGLLAHQQGRLTDTVQLLARAHQLDRASIPCEMRLGLAFLSTGQIGPGEAHLRQVIKRKPSFSEGWDNLAYALKIQDRLVEAIDCHKKSVELDPASASAWYNYGLTLSLAGRASDALSCHERAMRANADYPLAHFGRALALHLLHRIPEAVEEYGRFLTLRPDHHEARSYRLFALHYLDGMTCDRLWAEHEEFGRAVGTFPEPKWPNRCEAGRRLRVAILSPDLREHSCAYFIEPLLRHLDSAQFELYLYHDHFREDAVSERLRRCAAVWRNFVGLTGVAVERAIRADEPDILIDLAGHTGMTNRLPLFARRLAPVQITYLGYPNTTGLPSMNYRLTDEHADPIGEAERFATETLVRYAATAWTYAPPANAPEQTICQRSGAVVFGCFNTLAKITDSMLTVWGHLLNTVPGSRLLIKGSGLSDPAARADYQARLGRLNVPVDRVDLVERTPNTTSHLAVYHGIDIALDTFPYHGTTTTCEALWMGRPVVTLLGDRHASRVGASLLTAVGHPEWIARSEAEYVAIAVRLASDRGRLAEISDGLRDEMRRSPLLDHAGQAARFGEALRDCWKQWCAKAEEPKTVASSE